MAIISPEQSQSQIWNPHFTLSLLREFMTLVVFNSFFLIFFTLVIKISPSKSPSNSTHVCNVTSILLNLSIYPCNLEHYFYCFWFSIHKSTYDFVGIDCEAQLSCCIQSMEVLCFFSHAPKNINTQILQGHQVFLYHMGECLASIPSWSMTMIVLKHSFISP